MISPHLFDWFWWNLVKWCILPSQYDGVLNIWNFENPIYGRRLLTWKSKNRNISETVWTILTIFCTVAHISLPNLDGYSKIQILKNRRWRTAAVMKTVKLDISAIASPNRWHLVQWCILILPTRSLSKNSKVWKSHMVDGCHLEYWKITISLKPFGWFWWNFAGRHAR